MSTTLPPPEDRLRRADRSADEAKREVLEAVEEGFERPVEELSRSPEASSAFRARLKRIGERLMELRGDLEPSAIDRDQLHALHTAIHEARDLMQALDDEGSRLDALNELLIRIERIRHVLRDALDEHVAGIPGDAGQVVAQLDEWLPHVPRHEIARLAGVDRRTLTRWSGRQGPPGRRLQLVAQLVAVLRHSWTEDGVVAWFDRPNRDLRGRRPIAVLDDPNSERELLMAARATRSQYGT